MAVASPVIEAVLVTDGVRLAVAVGMTVRVGVSTIVCVCVDSAVGDVVGEGVPKDGDGDTGVVSVADTSAVGLMVLD